MTLEKVGKRPKSIVIGAKGRCGIGASRLLNILGIKPTLWGSNDTKGKGPFRELLKFDLLINTVFIKSHTLPFLNADMLHEERDLSVVSDVSCDPNGPYNPLPIYEECTTMDKPVIRKTFKKPLDITAIDHLPSLLPRESSNDFCEQLLPHLINFLNANDQDYVFERSLEIFYNNCDKFNILRNQNKTPSNQTLGI